MDTQFEHRRVESNDFPLILLPCELNVLCREWYRGGGIGRRKLALRLDDGDLHIVMDALKEHFTIESDDLALLGGSQGANECLENICTALVVKQLAELYHDLAIGARVRQPLQLGHQHCNFLIHRCVVHSCE
jgi:hypothetical protein